MRLYFRIGRSTHFLGWWPDWKQQDSPFVIPFTKLRHNPVVTAGYNDHSQKTRTVSIFIGVMKWPQYGPFHPYIIDNSYPAIRRSHRPQGALRNIGPNWIWTARNERDLNHRRDTEHNRGSAQSRRTIPLYVRLIRVHLIWRTCLK